MLKTRVRFTQDTLLELAGPTQNLDKKKLNQSSIQSMPLNASCMSWNPSERKISPSLSADLSFKAELPPQLQHDAKHLGLGVRADHGSCSSQSMGQSQDQCHSSESGDNEIHHKSIEGEMKPAYLMSNIDPMSHPSQVGYSNLVSQFHPYADPYFSGFLPAYGPQAIPPMVGIAPPRVPLPLDLQEDGPIYVNAKQYHGILRRRQSRAKMEAQNKLLKARRPYLHESRHLHALNRVRGSGGRFLSKKELEKYDQNPNSSSHHDSEAINFHHKDIQERETHHSGSSDFVTAASSHSDIANVSNTNPIFRQPDRRFSGGIPPHISEAMQQFSGGLMHGANQHCASVVQ